ncbi:putative immunity protein [Actinoplanes sp. NPDC023714]|uniref:putative immunity protein n=1 Tax=Actinoplanes sp. NPDC023714 TaxID=3154322 RepID=UPI0033E75002
MADEIDLSMAELREIAAFAARSAEDVLGLFAAERPDDGRPRDAVVAAWEFARGGRRGQTLRDTAWGALRAAKETGGAAGDAALAAMAAAGSAYLHPLAKSTQVKHILGSAAHAARAAELAAGGDRAAGDARIGEAAGRATPVVIAVLRRFPAAPSGGGRVGELIRLLDKTLRQ